MEGPTYKGREVMGGEGRREREGPPVITVLPGSGGARIVTAHLHMLSVLVYTTLLSSPTYSRQILYIVLKIEFC